MAYVGPAPANSIIATSDIEDGAVTSAKLGGNIVTPGTLDVNGQELILDANANTTITADTDDTIDIKISGADDFQFTANTFTAKSGSTITTPTIGVGTAHDLGVGVHVRTSDTGGSVSANSDELVLEGDGNAGLTILSKNDSVGQISFGDGDSTQKGIIQYAHGTDRLEFYTNDTKHMQIDSTGAVTKPLQPCVMVNPAGVQSNLAVSTTVDVIWGTERFDQNADFASNTFTAPVTGRYQVNVELRLDNLDTAANFLALYALSSNHNYASSILDYSVMGADVERWTQSFSGIIDMDASDTFKVQVYIDGGSAQTDVQTNSYLSIGLFA